MPVSTRWALLLALIALVAFCAVAPAAADDDDDCWGCANTSCVRLSRPTRGGRKLLNDGARTLLDDNVDDNDDDNNDDNDDDDDDDDSRRTCRRCMTGYALVNATDDGAIVGRCVCNAAQGFGASRSPSTGKRICVRCRDGQVPLSCSSNLVAAWNMDAGAWQLRLGNASSCTNFNWGIFRPEWEAECVPSSVRARMSVPSATFREFACVPCSRARAVRSGASCVAA